MSQMFAVVLVAISAVDGVRYKRTVGHVPKEPYQQDVEEPSQQGASLDPTASVREFSNIDTHSLVQKGVLDPAAIVRELSKIDTQSLVLDTISAVAEWDFSGNISQQLIETAASTGIQILTDVLTITNPFLGAVFGVFAGFLDFGGVDPETELISNILATVDKMIKQALSWYDSQQTYGEIVSLMSTVKNSDDTDTIDDEIVATVSKVFNSSCWANSNNCQEFYTTWGGGQALIYEIKFAELMVAQYVDVKLKGKNDPVFKNQLNAVKIRLKAHVAAWTTYRNASTWFHRGKVERKGSLYVITEQGYDSYLHSGDRDDKNVENSEYSGPNCASSAKYHRRRVVYPPGSMTGSMNYGSHDKTSDEMNRRVDLCMQTWKQSISDELTTMQSQVDALGRAIEKIMKA